jgi:hypothetical protein
LEKNAPSRFAFFRCAVIPRSPWNQRRRAPSPTRSRPA